MSFSASGGEMEGNEMAIKRLKVHQVDLIKMTEREKSRQMPRIQAEAVVMSTGLHPSQHYSTARVSSRFEQDSASSASYGANGNLSLFMALHEGKMILPSQNVSIF